MKTLRVMVGGAEKSTDPDDRNPTVFLLIYISPYHRSDPFLDVSPTTICADENTSSNYANTMLAKVKGKWSDMQNTNTDTLDQ